MRKQNIKALLCSINGGFLLIEVLITCVVLSFAILLCAHSFFTTVHEYTHAKQRLDALRQVQNSIEFSWIDGLATHFIPNIGVQTKVGPVECGIILPIIPELKQEWFEIEPSKNNKGHHLKVRGLIKEN